MKEKSFHGSFSAYGEHMSKATYTSHTNRNRKEPLLLFWWVFVHAYVSVYMWSPTNNIKRDFCRVRIVRIRRHVNLVLFFSTPSKQTICITFIQCWTNVFDVGPTLYKCYTNVLCLLGRDSRSCSRASRACGTLRVNPPANSSAWLAVDHKRRRAPLNQSRSLS